MTDSTIIDGSPRKKPRIGTSDRNIDESANIPRNNPIAVSVATQEKNQQSSNDAHALSEENDDYPFGQLNPWQNSPPLILTAPPSIFTQAENSTWHVCPEKWAGNYFYATDYEYAEHVHHLLTATAAQPPIILLSFRHYNGIVMIKGSGQELETLAMRLEETTQFKAPNSRKEEDKKAWNEAWDRAFLAPKVDGKSRFSTKENIAKRSSRLFTEENIAKWAPCDEGFFFPAKTFEEAKNMISTPQKEGLNITQKGSAIVVQGAFSTGLKILASRYGELNFSQPVPDENDLIIYEQAKNNKPSLRLDGPYGASLFQGENITQWYICNEGFFFPAKTFDVANSIASNLNRTEIDTVKRQGSAIIVPGNFTDGLQRLANIFGNSSFPEPTRENTAIFNKAIKEKKPFRSQGEHGAQLFKEENITKWYPCDKGFSFPTESHEKALKIAYNLNSAGVNVTVTTQKNTVIVPGNFTEGLQLFAHICGVPSFPDPTLRTNGLEVSAAQVTEEAHAPAHSLTSPHSIVNNAEVNVTVTAQKSTAIMPGNVTDGLQLLAHVCKVASSPDSTLRANSPKVSAQVTEEARTLAHSLTSPYSIVSNVIEFGYPSPSGVVQKSR